MNSQLLLDTSIPRWHIGGIARRTEWRLLMLVLALGDALGVVAGFYLAYALRFWTSWDIFQPTDLRPAFYAALTSLLVPCWLAIFAAYGLYDQRHLLGGTQEYARIFNGCLLGIVLVIVVSFLWPDFVIARAWLLLAWGTVLSLSILWRFGARRAVYALRRRGLLTERVLILGANAEGRAIAAQLSDQRSCGAQVVGFIDDARPLGTSVLPNATVLGPLTAFLPIVQHYAIDAVIIADPTLARDRLTAVYGAMELLQQLDVRLSPGLFELLTTGVQVREQGGVPLLSLNKTRITGPHALGKRLIDQLGGLAGVLLLSPVLAAIALLIFLEDGGPVLHRRRVLGFGKRPFNAFKFRTMIKDADGYLAAHPELLAEIKRSGKLKNDPRITRTGPLAAQS